MADTVKNWQYLSEYESHRNELLQIIDRVFSSGRLILGSEVSSFENNFSSFCGVKYGVGVNSGTDALFLALKALGIKEGAEVITVSNTAVPTVAAIRAAGALPVFVDVEEDTFLMDVNRVETVITGKTKCILPVHLFGQTADMEPLMKIAAANGLEVVEDCAQAAGALYRGKAAGSFGNLGAFSFYPTKILGAYGDAGMVITDRKEHYEKLKSLRFYGMQGEYYSEEEGYNSRLDEVQAAILNFRMKFLAEAVNKRRALAVIYSDGLASVGDISIPAIREDRSHQFYAFTIRTKSRNKLMSFLRENDIETRINYPTPIHLMRGYGFLGYKEGDFPVTERLSGEILSLPIFPGLSENTVERVIGAIRKYYRRR